jgi:hypothetical protein
MLRRFVKDVSPRPLEKGDRIDSVVRFDGDSPLV